MVVVALVRDCFGLKEQKKKKGGGWCKKSRKVQPETDTELKLENINSGSPDCLPA